MTTARDVVVAGPKLRALLAVLALHVGPGRSRRAARRRAVGRAIRRRRCATVCRASRPSCVGRWGRPTSSPCAATATSLELPPDAIDVHRFEQLVAAGRAAAAGGELDRAAALLAEADSLWRGDPLADFAYEDFAAAAITRLSELRLAGDRGAARHRARARPPPGSHRRSSRSSSPTHPLRERLRGLLMLALYRAGRQADALRIFQEGRHLLGEELGPRTRPRAPPVGVGDPRPGPLARRPTPAPIAAP